MKITKALIIGATTAIVAFGTPAIAQEMNHSGTSSPDAADQNQNINQGKSASTPKPDTRSTAVKHRTVRHSAKHKTTKSKKQM